MSFSCTWSGCDYIVFVFKGLGTGVIGAGIFGFLLKSEQFTDIFKKHITDVIYKPSDYQSYEELYSNWQKISLAILREVIPRNSVLAVEHIKHAYFNDALEYQYRDHQVTYKVSWKDYDKKLVQITARTQAKLIPSPRFVKPRFVYEFSLNNQESNEINLISFRIGDEDYKERINISEEGPIKILTLTTDLAHGVDVDLDRVVRIVQNQNNENFLKTKMIRYVNNTTVKFSYEENPEHREWPRIYPLFKPLGFSDEKTMGFHEVHPYKDDFHWEWKYKGLILPNQGYIVFLYEEVPK